MKLKLRDLIRLPEKIKIIEGQEYTRYELNGIKKWNAAINICGELVVEIDEKSIENIILKHFCDKSEARRETSKNNK